MDVVPFITGTGLVTPLGGTVQENWQALLAGKFITNHARMKIADGEESPRIVSLGLQAAREAIAAAGWSEEELGDERTALVVGTSKGAIESWMPLAGFASRTRKLKLARQIGLHTLASDLASELQLAGNGPRLTLSAACASGLCALIRAIMLLQNNETTRVLVVAAEASVHPLFIGSFQRLGVLPPEGFGCRPFDETRKGFLMSEAAAAICLETHPRPADSGERASARGSHGSLGKIIHIDHYALGSDATHLTGSDPAGKTYRRILQKVLDNRPTDLIHAHGTATPMNDAVELAAIEESLPASDHPTWLYSHKGAIGHSLGAAGLVSVALNIESHRRGEIPPNIQTRQPMPTRRATLQRETTTANIRRSVAIAAGFGGPVAAVSLASS